MAKSQKGKKLREGFLYRFIVSSRTWAVSSSSESKLWSQKMVLKQELFILWLFKNNNLQVEGIIQWNENGIIDRRHWNDSHSFGGAKIRIKHETFGNTIQVNTYGSLYLNIKVMISPWHWRSFSRITKSYWYLVHSPYRRIHYANYDLLIVNSSIR